MMNHSGHGTRRSFILAAAAWPALAWAGAAFGQAKKPPVVIGHLSMNPRSGRDVPEFKEELAALGWKEGSDYVLEERWGNGRWERLQPLAKELAARKPALIVARTSAAARAAAKAAPKTPIVMTGNPAAAGLAKSLARLGGMVTGIAALRSEVAEKYVELLLAAAPEVKRVGFLSDPDWASYRQLIDAARRSAAQYRVEARFADVGKAEEIEHAVSRLAKDGAQALVILGGRPGRSLSSGSASRRLQRGSTGRSSAGRARRPRREHYSVTEWTEFGLPVAPHTTRTASSEARSRPTCRSSSRPGSSWWST